MNIPLMNRLIAGGHLQEALDIVREEIALPLILGYICPAPCEKACHRRSVDEAVSICLLKRVTAQDDVRRKKNLLPHVHFSGKHVAIIGSGPAGLSAAFYIRRMGHECAIFEKDEKAGGAMRYRIPEENLPREALDAELEGLIRMGIVIRTGENISRARFEKEITGKYEAIILATGNRSEYSLDPFMLQPDENGNLIDRRTCVTSRPGIFGCGSAIREQSMAVRSAAQGRLAAVESDLYLKSGRNKRIHYNFHSAISHLLPEELDEYLKESSGGKRNEPAEGILKGFTVEEAMREAARCMHCDCRKPLSCKLRILSDEYDANRKRFAGPGRKILTKQIRHDLLVYEPEKCIKCGLCTEITASHKESLGLTFIGRGFDVKVGVPLNQDIHEGIEKSAFECAESCPTGALAFRDQEEGVEYRSRFRITGKGWEKIGEY
jgi:NADPH-dependent glutamate synthase beta subunit-like oxidoreductase